MRAGLTAGSCKPVAEAGASATVAGKDKKKPGLEEKAGLLCSTVAAFKR
jgi:hypothetical protein